jgi:hypothetical protein
VNAKVFRRTSVAAILLLFGACASQPSKEVVTPRATGGSVQDLAAAVVKDSQQSDTERDGKIREQLAAHAMAESNACLQLAPQAPACLYYRGVALGLEARAHPLRANELLTSMLETLTAAEAADADYDKAGPARVKALVLVRAPSWPLGPGDADTGVSEARKAVALEAQHPPNQLALAEALSKSGDADGARQAYQRAHDLAQVLPPSADRDDWLRQANEGLRR